MKKLYMLDAEIDYSACYYEGDYPELKAELKEVSIHDALKAMLDDIDCRPVQDVQETFNILLQLVKNGGYDLDKILEKAGYYHKRKIDKAKLPALISEYMLIGARDYEHYERGPYNSLEEIPDYEWSEFLHCPWRKIAQIVDPESLSGGAKKNYDEALKGIEELEKQAKELAKKKEERKKLRAIKKAKKILEEAGEAVHPDKGNPNE